MTNLQKKGWVRLHRQIEENPLYFLEPFTKAQAWIDLFLNANHLKGYFEVRGNIVALERGQIGWSELTMCKRWQWSRDKVRRFLKLLETEQQIEQQKTFITSIITIKNYDKFQQDNTAEQTAERQQTRHKQEFKNDKNNTTCNEQGSLLGDSETEIVEEKSLIPEVIKAFETVNPACSRMYGNKTQRKACQDLIDTYGFEQVQKVIAFLPQSNKMSFMPIITTPLQLWDKYQALKDRVEQKRSEINSKNIPNYIL